jgi:hypothetical protein
MTVVVQQSSSIVSIAETEDSVVVVNQESSAIEIQATPPSPILEFFGEGPQGVIGPQGEKGIDLDETAKIDGSVVYYDAASAKFKADATVTKTLLTDGGNF